MLMKKRTNALLIVFSVLIALVVVKALGVDAQTASPTPVATPSPKVVDTQAAPSNTPGPAPKVTAVEGSLELDDIIRVEVNNLSEWAQTNDPSKVVPYLNGRALRGNYPEEIHVFKNHLHFHLKITPENKNAWVDLLGAPEGTRKPVTFSVGLENQSPFDTVFDQGNELHLTVISPAYGVISLLVVLVTLILFLWWARTTSLIRAPGPQPAGGKLRPYNLGRAQMAFWFFLIYVSYLVIWLITGALDTITASLLGLMGISAGTALSEALIDSGKDTAKAGQLQDVTAAKQSLEQSIPELEAQIAAINAGTALKPDDTANRDSLNKQLQDCRARLAQINQQIQMLTPGTSANASKGFLSDILSDSSGYSFHRFQIFAWTIVLGIIFLSSVYNNLTMPEFSTTLLGLMGISSGTYIGFKFPEQK
jgi:hypothetical protein